MSVLCVFILYLEIGNRVATQAHVLYTRHKTQRKKKGGTDPAVISYYNSINFVLPGWVKKSRLAGNLSTWSWRASLPLCTYVQELNLTPNTHDTTTSTCLVGLLLLLLLSTGHKSKKKSYKRKGDKTRTCVLSLWSPEPIKCSRGPFERVDCLAPIVSGIIVKLSSPENSADVRRGGGK